MVAYRRYVLTQSSLREVLLLRHDFTRLPSDGFGNQDHPIEAQVYLQ